MPDNLPGAPSVLKRSDVIRQIALDVRSRPALYAEAGSWLDREYGAENCRRRHAEDERVKLSGSVRTFDSRSGCFMQAVWNWLDAAPDFLRGHDAAVIVLMTYLMIEPDADQRPLGLGGFESWPWGQRDSFLDPGSRQWAAALLIGYGRWADWMKLARRAWVKVADLRADEQQAKPARPRISKAEATVKAREFLLQRPDATVREVAAAVGCAVGTVSGLTPWKAVNEQRKQGRKPRSVALTDKMLAVTGSDDELARLIAEHKADDELSPVDPPRVKVYASAGRSCRLAGQKINH